MSGPIGRPYRHGARPPPGIRAPSAHTPCLSNSLERNEDDTVFPEGDEVGNPPYLPRYPETLGMLMGHQTCARCVVCRG